MGYNGSGALYFNDRIWYKISADIKYSYVGRWIIDGQVEGWPDKWIDR
jgi:hypothetical protein